MIFGQVDGMVVQLMDVRSLVNALVFIFKHKSKSLNLVSQVGNHFDYLVSLKCFVRLFF